MIVDIRMVMFTYTTLYYIHCLSYETNQSVSTYKVN